jgi:hypothetical protein
MPPQSAPQNSPDKDKDKASSQRRPPAATLWIMAILMLLLVIIGSRWFTGDRSEIDYTFFEDQLAKQNVKSLAVYGRDAYGEFNQRPVAPPRTVETASPATDTKDDDERTQLERKSHFRGY